MRGSFYGLAKRDFTKLVSLYLLDIRIEKERYVFIFKHVLFKVISGYLWGRVLYHCIDAVGVFSASAD